MWDQAVEQSRIWARRYARQEADAEDIAQEALLRAWRSRRTLESSERFQGWLATIVYREAARAHGRREPLPTPLEPDEIAVEDERLEQALEREDLRKLLVSLDPHERRLLHLRYGEDMTQPAIAQLLEVPEGTVKVQLHRARAKLRRTME